MKKRLEYFVPTLIAFLTATSYVALKTSLFSAVKQPASHSVQIGKDYYVAVTLIELTEHNPEGEPWDEYNGTGPDIFYEIYWKGTRIFQSVVKEDSFVAKWSNAEIDLAKLAFEGGATSLDSLVQGARLNIKQGEDIELRVSDSDVVKDDLAGTKIIKTTDLLVGDTTYEYSKPGIKRLILRVSDLSQPPDVSR